jgi:hypothetical protein
MPPAFNRSGNEQVEKSEMGRWVFPGVGTYNCLKSKEIPRPDESIVLKGRELYKSRWIYWKEKK